MSRNYFIIVVVWRSSCSHFGPSSNDKAVEKISFTCMRCMTDSKLTPQRPNFGFRFRGNAKWSQEVPRKISFRYFCMFELVSPTDCKTSQTYPGVYMKSINNLSPIYVHSTQNAFNTEQRLPGITLTPTNPQKTSIPTKPNYRTIKIVHSPHNGLYPTYYLPSTHLEPM